MPLTPRLAGIIAAMIDAKLDAEERRAMEQRAGMARAHRPAARPVGGPLGSANRGRR
jgi:hypothetical protein